MHNLPPPPQDIVQEYVQFGDGVPSSLLEKAIAPRTKEDATMLSRHFLGEDRVGPANVHSNDPDGMLAQAVAGTGVDPPIPDEMQGVPVMPDREKTSGETMFSTWSLRMLVWQMYDVNIDSACIYMCIHCSLC